MIAIKLYKKRLIVCIVSLLLVFCFHNLVSKQINFVVYSNGHLTIQDYAYHIIIVKTFWFDGFGNIYALDFQQQALSSYIGSNTNLAMPLGVTPLALVVWFPFSYVACYNLAFSYTLWVTLSVGVLLTAFWKIFRYVFLTGKQQALPIVFSLVTVFSLTTFSSIYLGQTSVFATGLLLHLIHIVHKKDNGLQKGDIVLIFLLIFSLGMKPPYIALGLGLLMIYGMWQETLYSILIVAIILIAITPVLTISWMPSYINLLQIHSMGTIPSVYAWSIKPYTMIIFRSAFRNLIGDKLSSIISNFVIYSVYIFIVGSSILEKIRSKTKVRLTRLKLAKGQIFVFLVASYLLFAPYAGVYEDVLLISTFVTVMLVGKTPNLTNYKSLVLVSFLLVILIHRFLPPHKPLWLFWILKALILGSMLIFCRFQKIEKQYSV